MYENSILTQRVSSPVLTEPGPSAEQLDFILQSALCAPDHACLRPWRFMLFTGEAREHLGRIFADMAREDHASEAQIQRCLQLPLRAPLIIGLILHYKVHSNVPEIEQILSLGAVGYGLLLATFKLGLGAYWRTGKQCFDARLAKHLNLQKNEKLLGLIYVGTPATSPARRNCPNVQDFVKIAE